MEIVNHIKYDLAKRGVPPVIDAVQGENNARIIELSLFANGSVFDVSGSVCSLSFSKPDGTSGWYDTMPDGSSAYETNGNVLRMKIAPQVLTVHGNVTAVVRIESGETSDRTTTFPLIISVSEDPAINALASENYYSVQNWDTVNQLLPNAILHIKQELSEAAKKQARKNIDAVGNGETLDLKGKAINNVGLLTLAHVGEDGSASGGVVSIRNLDTYDENNNLKVLISELFGNRVSLVGLSPGSDNSSAVTKGQMDDAIGDIETALDAIIAIQNELIGVITFTLYGITYTAVEGMTWGEWCNSRYNTDNAISIGTDGKIYSTGLVGGISGDGIIDGNGEYQYAATVIIAGGVYTSD